MFEWHLPGNDLSFDFRILQRQRRRGSRAYGALIAVILNAALV